MDNISGPIFIEYKCENNIIMRIFDKYIRELGESVSKFCHMLYVLIYNLCLTYVIKVISVNNI